MPEKNYSIRAWQQNTKANDNAWKKWLEACKEPESITPGSFYTMWMEIIGITPTFSNFLLNEKIILSLKRGKQNLSKITSNEFVQKFQRFHEKHFSKEGLGK